MNDKIIQRVFGVIFILIAIYTMNFSHWRNTAVFFILLLAGANSILKTSESEFNQKMATVCRRTALVIAIFTLARMLLQL